MPNQYDYTITGTNKIVIDVENRTGTRQGDGPILTAINFQWSEPINRIGTFRFIMPAHDRRHLNISPHSSVIRAHINGSERFLGIVREKTRTFTNTGDIVAEIRGESMLSEAAEHPIIHYTEFTDSNTIPSVLLTFLGLETPDTWALDVATGDGTTSANVAARFSGESVMSGLVLVAEKLNDFFYYLPHLSGDDREIIWEKDGHSSSGVRAIQSTHRFDGKHQAEEICYIQQLRLVDDASDVVNRIYPFGSGQGAARLSLAAVDAINRTKTISAINGDNTTTTVVTVENHGLSTTNTVMVHGTNGDLFDTDDETTIAAAAPDITKVNDTKFTYLSGDGEYRNATSGEIQFYSATKKITDTGNLLAGFSAYDNVIVSGGTANDGTYTIVSAIAGEIVVAESLSNEGPRNAQLTGQLTSGFIDFVDGNNYRYNTLSGDGYSVTHNFVESLTETISNNQPRRSKVVNFRDIEPISNTDADINTASDFLLSTSLKWLTKYENTKQFYELDVVGLSDVLKPGQSIDVVYEDDFNQIDATLNVLEIRNSIEQDGRMFSSLVVTDSERWPVGNADYLVGGLDQSAVYQNHAQLGANVDTVSVENILVDTTNYGVVKFWLGNEVATVQQVLLRFRIDDLRSTVRTVANTTSTTENGGASSPTSLTGNHVHPLQIPAGTITNNVGLDAGGGIVNASGGAATPSTQFETGGHTHTVNISAHSHQVAANLTAQYGVYENSSTHTYGSTQLKIKINGVEYTESLGAASDGWYTLDITSYVSDTKTFRPTQATHTIEFQDKLTAINLDTAPAVTKANPGRVTTAVSHGFTNGMQVYFTGLSGMTELNGNVYTVANENGSNQFDLSGLDTTNYNAHTSGGTVVQYKNARISAQIEKRTTIQSIHYV